MALRMSGSMQMRKAASVLPEPVGAEIRWGSGENGGPAFDLRLGWRAEAAEEPLLDEGVRPCEGLGWSSGLHWDIVAPGFRCFFARTLNASEVGSPD